MREPIDESMLETLAVQANTGGRTVAFELLPRLGAQLSSFSVDGQELLFFSRERVLEKGPTTGCFLMFPTPCRLTGSRYSFGGREILQSKGGKQVPIHGLVRDEPFAVERGPDYAAARIEIGPGHPVFEGYPFPCLLETRYQIVEGGLRISFAYENRGAESAPFGFGVHPYWLLEGRREDNAVSVPCEYAMELVDLIPTGSLDPVSGTPLDLRAWRSLGGVDIDNAFFGRIPGAKAGVEWRSRDQRLSIDASPELTHMIAYAPAGQPFVCVESLTCAPDMPNLYAKGFEKESGMVVVAPGQHFTGWITWTVENL
jgi:aldose 1-epimerase